MHNTVGKHASAWLGRPSHRTVMLSVLIASLYFVLLCYVSTRLPFSVYPKAFPDEDMRLRLPEFFYNHGYLPTGHEAEVRYERWGFSYASYPLMLTTFIAGLFMKMASFVTVNQDWLVFSARLVSIIAATVFAFFACLIGQVLFSGLYGWVFSAVILSLPQFIYCGLYFNNDMPALCGGSIVLYSWVVALRDGWKINNGIILSIGISIVALTYYNAYSWILLSIFIYFIIWMQRYGSFAFLVKSDRSFWVITATVVGLTCLLVVPWFIRTGILNHGDFLGFATIRSDSAQYGVPELKPDLRPSPKNLGMSVFEMLLTTHYMGVGRTWILVTFESLVGAFGYMNVYLPKIIYLVYAFACIVGLCLFVGSRIINLFNLKHIDWRMIVLDILMISNTVIVLGLSVVYSYATDYQAQGRYIFPMLLSLVYMVISGWKSILGLIRVDHAVKVGVAVCIIGLMLIGDVVAYMILTDNMSLLR